MKHKKSRRWMSFALVAGFIAMMGGCSGGSGYNAGPKPPGPDFDKSVNLAPFANCDELVSEVKEMLAGEMEKRADSYRTACRYEYDDGDGTYYPASPAIPAQEDSAGADATGTNLQEEGVDEADLIKTDGQYSYAIMGGAVKVVRVWPFDKFGEVAKITPQGEAKGLYLADSRLTVIGEMAQSNNSASVFEEVFDVSNPAAPKKLAGDNYSGTLLDSRRLGSKLHLVVDNTMVYPIFDYNLNVDYESWPVCPRSGKSEPTKAILDAIESMKERNMEKIEVVTIASLFPGLSGAIAGSCNTINRTQSSAGRGLVTLITSDLSEASLPPSAVSIFGPGGAVYASANSIYVATAANPFGWWVMDDEDSKDETVIHRFSIAGETPVYRGTAKVDGHIADNRYVGSRNSARFSMASFSMSEYAGHLRVATTNGHVSPGGQESESSVVVLDAKKDGLEKVGEVGGIGIGERIYSVRFARDRAYVVTFKKVDPLYVLDLADPRAPVIAGELKVPGFSTYLHPADEDHLIGLGFGADDMGSFAWTQGLKIALFDVSDPANPSEIGNREIGARGSYSAAIEEHHAFTFDPSRGIIALPVDITEGGGGSSCGATTFSGVMVLRADDDGAFETVGEIAIDSAGGWCGTPWGGTGAGVLRTVIIGDRENDGVISLTENKLHVNRIDAGMSAVGIVTAW